jgi:hypothetical protein
MFWKMNENEVSIVELAHAWTGSIVYGNSKIVFICYRMYGHVHTSSRYQHLLASIRYETINFILPRLTQVKILTSIHKIEFDTLSDGGFVISL